MLKMIEDGKHKPNPAWSTKELVVGTDGHGNRYIVAKYDSDVSLILLPIGWKLCEEVPETI